MKIILIAIVFLLFILYRPITFQELKSLNKDNYTITVQGYLNEGLQLEIARGSTINDVLKELTIDEHTDLTHLNLSQKVLDHDLIVLRKKTELKKISINTATKEELMTLKGIKEKMAQRILDYRSAQTFKKLEDLKNVKGCGDKLYETLKDFITL